MDLKNKKVLVTGGAVRIGSALCRKFASLGAKVIVHYNNSRTEAEALFEELGGVKMGHGLTDGDLTSQAFVKDLIPSLKRVDVLVNNAALFETESLEKETMVAARTQYEVNFWAPLTLMQQFRKQNLDEGLIINMLDQRITSRIDTCGSYILSKKSLADATRLAAAQWAPRVRVNGISPGTVIPPVHLPDSKMEKSIALTPMKKPVTTEEIANACVFLAENDSITGEVITLDGGQHLTNLL